MSLHVLLDENPGCAPYQGFAVTLQIYNPEDLRFTKISHSLLPVHRCVYRIGVY